MKKKGDFVAIAFFSFWALILTMRLFDLMIADKRYDNHARILRKERALRGAITDKIGHKIAWSTRHINLHINPDKVSAPILENFNHLIGQFYPNYRDTKRIENLKPEHFIIWRRQFPRISGIEEEVIFKRHYSRGIDQNQIGLIENGIGVSGIEAKFDKQLKGRDLIYEYYLDNKKQIIKGSIFIIQDMQPGQDIALKEDQWL